MATYYGKVSDSLSGAGIPGATVTLMRGQNIAARTNTDINGNFSITSTAADALEFSSVGYKPWSFPASEYQHVFELERDIRVIDPVILPPYPVAQKNKFLFPALALLGLLMLAKKKR